MRIELDPSGRGISPTNLAKSSASLAAGTAIHLEVERPFEADLRLPNRSTSTLVQRFHEFRKALNKRSCRCRPTATSMVHALLSLSVPSLRRTMQVGFAAIGLLALGACGVLVWSTHRDLEDTESMAPPMGPAWRRQRLPPLTRQGRVP